MAKKTSFEIVITKPAASRYRKEVLAYVLQHFSLERAIKIDSRITASLESLGNMPERGSPEPQLLHRKKDYRFILFKESRNLELKIIYYIGVIEKIVYITDFFPVLMNPVKIQE